MWLPDGGFMPMYAPDGGMSPGDSGFGPGYGGFGGNYSMAGGTGSDQIRYLWGYESNLERGSRSTLLWFAFPQNPGGQFPDNRGLEIELVKLEVKNLLQNPTCAAVLGGVENAKSLLGRAQVLNAGTLSPTYRGTEGMFSSAANSARAEAANPTSQILAYSESGSASRNGRTIQPRNIYLTDRFFKNVGPSQQDTVFIHELNRLNGYSRGYKEDYANITKACGTADPFGPRQ